MTDWYSTVYKAFIISAVIAFITGIFVQPETAANAYITGYSMLTLGIMLILIQLFNKISSFSQQMTSVQTSQLIFATTLPFITILGVIIFMLYILIKYNNNIISGHISPNYTTFSNINVILLLLQLYIMYNNMSTSTFEITGKLSKLTTSIIYLISTLTGISSFIIYIILKYYSTDGFTNKSLSTFTNLKVRP